MTEGSGAAQLAAVEAIARAAGDRILAVYAAGSAGAQVDWKADESPVTLADREAEALITPALRALTPGWPVVAEEAMAAGAAAPTPDALRGGWWLVDPLDGTREFLARNGEFTVNIALMQGDAPVLGVVYQPVGDVLYSGIVGQGAWREQAGQRQALRVAPTPVAGWRLAGSRSHGDDAALALWLSARGLDLAEKRAAGSSLKFGLLAAGEADVYPRLGPTMEWDTAAGDAVLRAAGGVVETLDGEPLRYGRPGFRNPHFVAWGPAAPLRR